MCKWVLCLAFASGILWAQPPAIKDGAKPLYEKAKASLAAKNDVDALSALEGAAKADPQSIEVLNDLTYLQATSSNAKVRNPRAALKNAGKLLDLYYQQFINRRQYQSAASPRGDEEFYRVVVPNTFAVMYAANKQFQGLPRNLKAPASSEPPANPQPPASPQLLKSAGGGACAPAALSTATLAVQEAQTLAGSSPSSAANQAVEIERKNLSTIQAHKAIIGAPQPPRSAPLER
jgi:hypothetical protein